MMLLYYLEREREREYRGGSASFEANLRGEEKERRTDKMTTEREIFEFHMTTGQARSIKGEKKRLIPLLLFLGKRSNFFRTISSSQPHNNDSSSTRAL
jgi:hypothetical protein